MNRVVRNGRHASKRNRAMRWSVALPVPWFETDAMRPKGTAR